MFKHIQQMLFRQAEASKAQTAIEIMHESEEPLTANINQNDRSEFSVHYKNGVVTRADKNGIFKIDNIYEFKLDEGFIKPGTKVGFLLTIEEDGAKISKVTPIYENVEEDEINNSCKIIDRAVIGKISKRNARIITVNSDEVTIDVDLNVTRSLFIPKVGDWVDLDVKAEIDENVVGCLGKIIEVNIVKPIRLHNVNTVIDAYSRDSLSGQLDGHIYFDRESLAEGYLPKIGDQVVAAILESDQGQECNWRALTVKLEASARKYLKFDNLSIPKTINYDSNVDGIAITDSVKVNFYNFNEIKTFVMEIVNEKEHDITLNDVNYDTYSQNQINLLSPKLQSPIVIASKNSIKFKFEISAKTIGKSSALIVFIFQNFNIGRVIEIYLKSITPDNNIKNCKTGYNYVNQMKSIRSTTDNETIRGQRLNVTPRFVGCRMKEYKIPDKLWDLFLTHEDKKLNNPHIDKELFSEKYVLKEELCFRNYEERFHTLLYMEEIECTISMRKYDQKLVTFTKEGEYLLLAVNNLAEKRPSIIIGDKIIAMNPTNPGNNFEGFVHRVTNKHVYLKFSPIFQDNYNGEQFSVHAVLSRIPIRKLHHAIYLAVRNLGRDFLFPSHVVLKSPQVTFSIEREEEKKFVQKLSNKEIIKFVLNLQKNPGSSNNVQERVENKISDSGDPELQWFDKTLNCYQREAVINILRAEARPLPYIIFGPPGTGKTVTIIESILQILKMIPNARILVAAPSNSAADIIALRLIETGMKPGDLIRFTSFRTVIMNSIPDKLKKYSATGNIARAQTVWEEPLVENGITLGCPIAVFARHKVIVGTCTALGTLHNMGLTNGHFSHIFVDEAEQCTEPEIMIPLGFVDVNNGQAILSGDPMQLGPVICSKQASNFGLGDSFLNRLLNRFPHIRDLEGFPDTGGYDPRLVTYLIYNYRSLPGIIDVPNKLFYHSELKPKLSERDSAEAIYLNRLKSILPRGGNFTPALIFHGLNSRNYQCEDSPSWYNPDEVGQVFYYVNKLYYLGVKSEELGIISPYNKQVRQIRSLLQETGLSKPKVGTVEEFQGHEFKVILLSTVRSNANFIKGDTTHQLGFIANPKRLNVALTRAQCLCVVIGNPHLLIHDPFWRILIEHCIDNSCYVGCDLQSI